MIRRILIGWALLLWTGHAAVTEPPLPVWTEEDRKVVKEGKWMPGRYLLTDEVPKDEPPAEKPQPLPVEGPTAEELGDQTPPNEIPEKFLTTYFNERPTTFLIDPQKLLSPQEYRDRLAFLNYHASETSIDLFVYVFDKSQELPGEVRAEELAERFFATGRPAAFVYYFLGAPQRSVLYLSPSLTDTVSSPDQRRALQSSVEKSLEKPDPVDQLDGFTVQMSIRIYWMERMLSGASVPEGILSSTAAVKPAVAEVKAGLFDKLPPGWWQPVALLGGCVLAGAGGRIWLRYRARYRFPDFNVEPRLGGDHAAGIGAVISFASASLPPAVQREQVPDYLRRA